ncbi:MAG TPA: SIMPL domain-containing protein [Streptosporangiaceae bacterium]
MIGAFTLGASRSGGATSAGPTRGGATLVAAVRSGRITVTGSGTVTGTPNQITLTMGVQVNGSSVASALQQANQAVRRVTAALRARGVVAADIQTSGLYIQPNYQSGSQTPSGYGVSESLTATLTRIAAAGGQITAAVHAGGNATTVSGVSLNLTDDSRLLATARARAVADARVKAAQYAHALGQPLGPVISITDQSSSWSPPVPMAASGSAAKSAVPISPGSQQLSVSISAVYGLG